MAKTYFVTGTDTDAGKTVVTCGLLAAARAQGLSTLALKPVAAGCRQTAEGLRNDDALELIQAITLSLPYEQINPLALEPAIAPHIAANDVGMRITLDRLTGYCRGALLTKHDLSFIEGAGGWRVPLNDREMLSSLAKELNIPAILVVSMKLGCISHALLTVEAILRDGVKLAGWIANQITPELERSEENFQTLKNLIPAPCLGSVPFMANPCPTAVADHLDIEPLTNNS